MALIPCKECGKEISDKAVMCPHCGFSWYGSPYGFEYRSKTRLFGLPLVHIVYGPNRRWALSRSADFQWACLALGAVQSAGSRWGAWPSA
jgi:hypothetical protein